MADATIHHPLATPIIATNEMKLRELLDFLLTTGRCPICEHRIAQLHPENRPGAPMRRSPHCHCDCHDPEGGFIDEHIAYAYIKRGQQAARDALATQPVPAAARER